MKTAAGRRGPGTAHRLASAGTVSLFVLMAMGCDPPGKPGPPEIVNKEKIMDFAELYGDNCAGCHSADGKSGPGRPLNNALYLSIIPRDTLRNTIYYGRPGTAMPAWAISQGGPLTDKQVDGLVDGIEQNWAKPMNAPAAAGLPSYAATGAGDPANGKKLFGRACFMCHGKGAPIGPVTDPSYLALVSDQLLRTAIIEGWPTLGMPDYRTVNLGHALSDENITDVVSYLSSLRPTGPNSQSLHTVENGTGQSGDLTKGNEGSGHGPGSPHQQKGEGNKSTGASSQGGGIK